MTTIVEECGYVGSCAVKDDSVYAVSAAVGLLQIKLIKLNKKVVTKLSKSFKKKVVKDSPEYRQIYEKMKANGLDYTLGDNVRVEAAYADLHLVELATNTVTDFDLKKIVAHYVLPSKMSKERDMALFVFVVVTGGKSIAHVLQAAQPTAEHLNSEMGRLVAVASVHEPYVIELGDAETAEDKNSITLGIGLHKTSDLEFDKGALQRKGTWNLKGNKKNGAKRRSATYAASFKSFGTSTLPKATVATDEDIENENSLKPEKETGLDYRDQESPEGKYQTPHDSDEEESLTKTIEALKGRSLSTDNLFDSDAVTSNVMPDDSDEDDDDDIEVEVFGFEGEAMLDAIERNSVAENDDGDSPQPPPRLQATEAESEEVYMQPTSIDEDSEDEAVNGFEEEEAAEDLDIPQWYHGKIGRVAAELMLGSAATPHGGFLIRDSDSSNVHLTMSIRNGNKVVHCRVIRNSKDLFAFQVCALRNFIDKKGNKGGPWFKYLSELAITFTHTAIPTLFRQLNQQLVPVKLTRKHNREYNLDPRSTLCNNKQTAAPPLPPISSIPRAIATNKTNIVSYSQPIKQPPLSKAINGARPQPAMTKKQQQQQQQQQQQKQQQLLLLQQQQNAKAKANSAAQVRQMNFAHLGGSQPPVLRAALSPPQSPRTPLSPKGERKKTAPAPTPTPTPAKRDMYADVNDDDQGDFELMPDVPNPQALAEEDVYDNMAGGQLIDKAYASVEELQRQQSIRHPPTKLPSEPGYQSITQLKNAKKTRIQQDSIKSGTSFGSSYESPYEDPSIASTEYSGFGSESEETFEEENESPPSDAPLLAASDDALEGLDDGDEDETNAANPNPNTQQQQQQQQQQPVQFVPPTEEAAFDFSFNNKETGIY